MWSVGGGDAEVGRTTVGSEFLLLLVVAEA